MLDLAKTLIVYVILFMSLTTLSACATLNAPSSETISNAISIEYSLEQILKATDNAYIY